MKSKTRSSDAKAGPALSDRPAPLPSKMRRLLPWAVLAASVLFVAAVRIRLLQLPLERDEGEYAYAGQLLLEGIPPYRDAFNMKFPGVYGAYALIMAVFGQSITGIRVGFLLWNAATIVLVFFLGRRLFGAGAGAAAAAAYAVLSISTSVLGLYAHATHFVVLPVVAACLLLLRAIDGDRLGYLAGSGVLFGTAILMKQHGVFFALLGPACLLWDRHSARRESWAADLLRLAIFCAGLALPLVLTGIALAAAGVFQKFWFWTFTYASEYVTEMPLSLGIANLGATFSRMVGSNLLLWLFAAEGLAVVWWKKEDRRAAALVTVLLVCSFVAVCPGFYFRDHYYVLVLPAAALLAGVGFQSLQRLTGNAISIALYALVLLFSIYQQSDVFFRLSPTQVSRRIYFINPFNEALPMGEYIRTHSPANARIAVMGSEPEIYFYAHRLGATGYIYMYGMMEPQPYALKMQSDMIHDIETVRPTYIVLATGSTSWDIRRDSSHHILEWFDSYSARYYKRAGFAEVLSPDQTQYHWSGRDTYDPKSDVVLVLFERK